MAYHYHSDYMNQEKLNVLIERTSLFQSEVHAHVGTLVPFESARHLISFQAGLLSLEHASGALILVDQGLFPSAYALMRPQFESLVRGIWLLYAATDNWVEKLGEPLTVENAKRANEGPMLADMLKGLDNSAGAPKPLVEQLKQYRDVTWKALNSFSHGGLHPLSRTITGYPEQLTYDVLRNSNAVVAIAAQLSSILTGNPESMNTIRRLHKEYADCLPMLHS